MNLCVDIYLLDKRFYQQACSAKFQSIIQLVKYQYRYR